MLNGVPSIFNARLARGRSNPQSARKNRKNAVCLDQAVTTPMTLGRPFSLIGHFPRNSVLRNPSISPLPGMESESFREQFSEAFRGRPKRNFLKKKEGIWI
jgi:hypothetical protein